MGKKLATLTLFLLLVLLVMVGVYSYLYVFSGPSLSYGSRIDLANEPLTTTDIKNMASTLDYLILHQYMQNIAVAIDKERGDDSFTHLLYTGIGFNKFFDENALSGGWDEFKQLRQDHPNWFLYDAEGNLLYDRFYNLSSEDLSWEPTVDQEQDLWSVFNEIPKVAYFMDISKPEVREYLIDRTLSRLEQYPVFDGIFLDIAPVTVDPEGYYAGKTYDVFGNMVMGSDDDAFLAYAMFCQELRDALATKDKILFINGINMYQHEGSISDIQPFIDGFVEEDGLGLAGWGYTNDNIDPRKDMETVTSYGNPYWITLLPQNSSLEFSFALAASTISQLDGDFIISYHDQEEYYDASTTREFIEYINSLAEA